MKKIVKILNHDIEFWYTDGFTMLIDSEREYLNRMLIQSNSSGELCRYDNLKDSEILGGWKIVTRKRERKLTLDNLQVYEIYFTDIWESKSSKSSPEYFRNKGTETARTRCKNEITKLKPFYKFELNYETSLKIVYDYIDLSIIENRRIFITEDGKPT